MIYFKIFKVLLKSYIIQEVQFKLNFIFTFFTTLLSLVAQLVIFYYIFNQSNLAIEGWNYERFMLYFGMYELIISLLSGIVLPNLSSLPNLIHSGHLDFYILKPINLAFLISFRRFNFNHLPRFAMAIVVMGCSFYYNDINILNALIFFAQIFVSVFIAYTFMFLICLSSFMTIRLDHLEDVISHIFAFGKYPINIYDQITSILFTYIFPIAFIFTFPVEAIFSSVATSLNILLLSGVVLFLLTLISYLILKYSLRKYSGAMS